VPANQRGRLIAQRCHQSVTFLLHDKCCVVGRSLRFGPP
jgi:hypothetical protein